MSLSTPTGSRPARLAVTAPMPAVASGSVESPPEQAERFELQGSNIFDGILKQNDQGRSLIACTTRMFEIFGASVCLKPRIYMRGSASPATWIVTTASVHRSFVTHTLAAVRLFT